MAGSSLQERFDEARFGRWLGRYFALAAFLFALGALGGYAVADPELVGAFAGSSGESVLPAKFTVWTIFLNNLIAVGVTALGLVTLGLAAAFSVMLNGFFLGLVVGLATPTLEPATVLALILPHGVIELTAFFLVAGTSFRVTHRLARYLAGHDETILTHQELFEIGVLLVVAVGLLAVAAWIEIHVTPAVGEAVT